MSAARFFQLIAGSGKRPLEEPVVQEEAMYEFVRAPKDIKWQILKTLWKQGQIKEVIAICSSKNKEIRRFCKEYTHPARGGVLGALLEWTNPQLKDKRFPYLSYLVLKFPDMPWNFFQMGTNESLVWEVVLANPGKRFHRLITNPCVTVAIFKAHMQTIFKQGNGSIEYNPNFTVADVMSFLAPELFSYVISLNRKMTNEFMEENVENFEYDLLSTNLSIGEHIDFVRRHLDKPWKWSYLTQTVALSVIEANPDLPWDESEVDDKRIESSRPKFTMDYINQNRLWQKSILSKVALQDNITWSDIRSNPDLPWDWEVLSVKEDQPQ